VLVGVPLHVLTGDVQPDRCWLTAGCPFDGAGKRIQIDAGRMLFKAAGGDREPLRRIMVAAATMAGLGRYAEIPVTRGCISC
jgi:hypothetical protein